MVRQCYVCKVYDYKPEAQHLTFHRLPQNIERRQVWLSALGYDENHQFPKQVEICSKHFSESDFEYKEDGSKSLNKDAVPCLVHSAFDPSSSGTFRKIKNSEFRTLYPAQFKSGQCGWSNNLRRIHNNLYL